MFCSECGSSTAGAKFCPECGTSVDGSTAAVVNNTQPLAKPQVTTQEQTSGNSNTAIKALGFIAVLIAVGIYFVVKATPHNSDNTSSQDVVSAETTVTEPSETDLAKESISDLTITPIDGRWPTMCQEVMGAGWSCWVDLKVTNNSATAWDGHLTGELVSSSGSRSASSDSSDVSELTGDFWTTLNPSTSMEWVVYFAVGPGQKFTELDILSDGAVAQSIPVCLGSSDELSMGC